MSEENMDKIDMEGDGVCAGSKTIGEKADGKMAGAEAAKASEQGPEYTGSAGNAVSNKGIYAAIADEFPLNATMPNLYSPLVLAYAGDAVYELYIRTLLLSRGNATVNSLHRKSVSFVKAKSQSDIIHKIMDILTAEEQEIVRRGRNAKSGTIPKNADVVEYKYATGFESLIGYLYLKGDYTRLLELLKISVESCEDGI